ncbi:hypothetical protein OG453_09385 [Streptomyces sp. NBC_01381]|uniref:hypothetical protein n=1 Tax=Streptomyces sp. NBC_01381 TaxID=2903845 RepID=UPI002250FE9A|nr:hypothetical protein [Streptomyces sp. NBC_01381]MCX4666878.1 hypothetical protein [Streptomyces sp. NBC_01381]
MDNWREDALPEHTHDPNEVTVQIDGVGRQLADFSAGSDQDAPDGPVFVDETGRRSRRYRRIGVIVAIACAVYAVIIVGTLLSGNSSAPWLPVKPKDDKPASQVDTPDRPADSADPSASPGVTPSPGATDASGTAPAPGGSDPADPTKPGDGTGKPGESPDPDPTDDGKPDPDPTDDGGDPDPTDKPTTPDPDPDPTEPTDPPTDPDPTESSSGGAGGGGEVPVVNPAADQQSTSAQSVGYQSPQSADQQPSEAAQR